MAKILLRIKERVSIWQGPRGALHPRIITSTDGGRRVWVQLERIYRELPLRKSKKGRAKCR